MAEIISNQIDANGTVHDVKCRSQVTMEASAPSGVEANSRALGGDFERKRRTRRRKTKRKKPYSKPSSETRGRKTAKKSGKRLYATKQPEAPYNSNRFLIEDHNEIQDFEDKLRGQVPHRPRVRDSSFTSVDSDEDYFYSSPEDEEEFLTKEFSNTYQDLHVESLTQMSKADLIQQVLQLEEKVDLLEKRLFSRKQDKGGAEIDLVDQILKFQQEISKLALVNEELTLENERLRRGNQCLSGSSMDSESDSSSSCSSKSSDLSQSENELDDTTTTKSHQMNGDVNEEVAPMNSENTR